MEISILISLVGLVVGGDYVQTENQLSYYDIDYDGFNAAQSESKLICSKVRVIGSAQIRMFDSY